VELFDAEISDYGFAFLEGSIMAALRDATLSDRDVYPLLVRISTGRSAAIAWPPQAPEIARRCATTLASAGPCVWGALTAPTERSVQTAGDAIVAELGLTPRDLLGVLADHWQELSPYGMPRERASTLLAFARHVLVEPAAAACVLMWSALNAQPVALEPHGCPSATDGRPAAATTGWMSSAPRSSSSDTPIGMRPRTATMLTAFSRPRARAPCVGAPSPGLSPTASCGRWAGRARRARSTRRTRSAAVRPAPPRGDRHRDRQRRPRRLDPTTVDAGR
jgi:hypothetical protein